MSRYEANKKILEKLAKIVEEHPDWRFGQILINTNVVKRCDFTKCFDPFYEESVKTLEDMGDE